MSRILQLKVTLRGSKPPVWRRFLVEDSISFHELHEIIQTVMGWEDYHLYQFEVGRLRIGEPNEELEFVDSGKMLLKGAFSGGGRFVYEYDFGDSWVHAIVVEKVMKKDGSQKYPVCIGGKRACPPEDCGGIWGYEELLEVLKDKKHEEYEEMNEWVGEDFDPEHFDIDKINDLLR